MTDFLCFDLIEVFVRTKQNILIVLQYLIIIWQFFFLNV